jgi:hypothetical protein
MKLTSENVKDFEFMELWEFCENGTEEEKDIVLGFAMETMPCFVVEDLKVAAGRPLT